jgi:cobyrinic acid a,c-diamide synthase
MDAAGSQSTAELAKLLDAPVILILDCDKVTRTAAAMTLGCQKFDPGVDMKGVILNRVARSRQEEILRRSIEQYCHLPVLGAVPRMEDFPFPERHLGLTPPQEHAWVQKALGKAIEVAEKYLDLEQLWEIAGKASPGIRRIAGMREMRNIPVGAGRGLGVPVIGVVKDSAFQFYYPENLQTLANQGATVIEISPMREKKLPAVDALYIGGGFPETHAQRLAANVPFRNSLRQAIENGLPVYAECGGLMYLGESLILDGRNYPMVGALPIAFQMEKRPQGHGYTLIEVEKENPFFPVGFVWKGHEFHYSRLLWLREGEACLAFKVKRGAGIDGQRDGLCRKNVLATYSHVHALGTGEWSYALVEKARSYRLGKKITMAAV